MQKLETLVAQEVDGIMRWESSQCHNNKKKTFFFFQQFFL